MRTLRVAVVVAACIFATQVGCLSSRANLIDYKSITTPHVVSDYRTELKVYFAGLEKSDQETSLGVNDFNYAFKRHLQNMGAFTMVDDQADSDITIGGKCSWNSEDSGLGYLMVDLLVHTFTMGMTIFAGIPTQWADGTSQIDLEVRDTRSTKMISTYHFRSAKRIHAGLYYGWGWNAAAENANRVMKKALLGLQADLGTIQQKHLAYKDLPPPLPPAPKVDETRTASAGLTGDATVPLIARLLAQQAQQAQQQTAARPVATAPKGEFPIVAVFNIEDGSAIFKRESLDQLTDYLCSKVASDAGFRVVPREQLRARIVEEKKLSHSDCFDGVCQIEMGKAMSAQMSLSTKIIRIGTQCAITSMLYDLRTETASTSATVRTGCSEDNLMDGIDKVVRQFAGAGG